MGGGGGGGEVIAVAGTVSGCGENFTEQRKGRSEWKGLKK